MSLALCNTPAQTLFPSVATKSEPLITESFYVGLVPTLEGALSRSDSTVCLITFMLMVVLFDLK